eukprot:GHVS01038569.1.p1 GENE.GHVS01038569.1~~GHVS01038569.1.p1  ORF type:complete len:400 (+),score=93.18 GHVS01038569.1:212-1411(+)
MGTQWFRNAYLCVELQDDQMREIPYPLTEVAIHTYTKLMHYSLILGTCIVGPTALLVFNRKRTPSELFRSCCCYASKWTKDQIIWKREGGGTAGGRVGDRGFLGTTRWSNGGAGGVDGGVVTSLANGCGNIGKVGETISASCSSTGLSGSNAHIVSSSTTSSSSPLSPSLPYIGFYSSSSSLLDRFRYFCTYCLDYGLAFSIIAIPITPLILYAKFGSLAPSDPKLHRRVINTYHNPSSVQLSPSVQAALHSSSSLSSSSSSPASSSFTSFLSSTIPFISPSPASSFHHSLNLYARAYQLRYDIADLQVNRLSSAGALLGGVAGACYATVLRGAAAGVCVGYAAAKLLAWMWGIPKRRGVGVERYGSSTTTSGGAVVEGQVRETVAMQMAREGDHKKKQ